MLKYYPQFGLGFVWDELSMGEGYAYITVAMSLDGWCQFSGIRAENSYVEQEVERLMVIAKQAWELK